MGAFSYLFKTHFDKNNIINAFLHILISMVSVFVYCCLDSSLYVRILQSLGGLCFEIEGEVF